MKWIQDVVWVHGEIPMDKLLEIIFKAELWDKNEPEDIRFNMNISRIFTFEKRVGNVFFVLKLNWLPHNITLQ